MFSIDNFVILWDCSVGLQLKPSVGIEIFTSVVIEISRSVERDYLVAWEICVNFKYIRKIFNFWHGFCRDLCPVQTKMNGI